jgi:hypothetical protein
MRPHASKRICNLPIYLKPLAVPARGTRVYRPGSALNSIDVILLLKLLDIRQVGKGFALMRRAAIVGPLRTRIGTFGGSLRPLTAAQLATTVIKAVVARSGPIPI